MHGFVLNKQPETVNTNYVHSKFVLLYFLWASIYYHFDFLYVTGLLYTKTFSLMRLLSVYLTGWGRGLEAKYLGKGTREPRTRDRGPGTEDPGPRTRDRGPRTEDQGPGTED